MNRRQILRTGSLGTLGFLAARPLPTALGQTRAAGANERIRIGIVGFSDRFRSSLMPAFPPPLFSPLHSGHPLFQQPSPQKQITSN